MSDVNAADPFADDSAEVESDNDTQLVDSDSSDTTPVDPDVKVVSRRDPIPLEPDVKQVCDDFIRGSLVLPEGKFLTSHVISQAIGDMRGGKSERPSSGAVQARLKQWVDIGFIEVNEKPFAFLDYTQAGVDRGLQAVKDEFNARKKAARAAEKAAKKDETTEDSNPGSTVEDTTVNVGFSTVTGDPEPF